LKDQTEKMGDINKNIRERVCGDVMEQLQHGIQREIWTFKEIQFILNFHVALNTLRLNRTCVTDTKDNKSSRYSQ
jgi:hypothetical protein